MTEPHNGPDSVIFRDFRLFCPYLLKHQFYPHMRIIYIMLNKRFEHTYIHSDLPEPLAWLYTSTLLDARQHAKM